MASPDIPVAVMRTGTSQAVFFDARDLPVDRAARDALLSRILPAAEQYPRAPGNAGAPERLVLVEPARDDDCDVEYRVGERAASGGALSWSEDGGMFTGAVAVFAVRRRLVTQAGLLMGHGDVPVRIRVAGAGRRVVANVPMRDGHVVEDTVFVEDGSPFPASPIRLDCAEAGPALLPTGRVQDEVDVPGLGAIAVTMLWAGAPVVFARASDLGLTAREHPEAGRRPVRLPDTVEALRAVAVDIVAASVASRLAARVQSGLRVAWVAPPVAYRTLFGLDVAKGNVDVLARMTGQGHIAYGVDHPGAVALAAAAALPGSIVAQTARTLPGVETRVGQACGVLTLDATVQRRPGGAWVLKRASLLSSARLVMHGWLPIPAADAARRPGA